MPITTPAKPRPPTDDGLTQSERFMQTARDLECDDDPERFAERVRKLVKVSPGPQPSDEATPSRTKE